MTDAELAAIRGRSRCTGADVDKLLAHIDALTAEVERLKGKSAEWRDKADAYGDDALRLRDLVREYENHCPCESIEQPERCPRCEKAAKAAKV